MEKIFKHIQSTEIIRMERKYNYIHFVEGFLNFVNIEGEIKKKYYSDGEEMLMDLIEIPSNKFGLMHVYGPDTWEFEITSMTNFNINHMRYFNNYIFPEHDNKINLSFEQINYTEHNCPNATIIKTTMSSDADLCVFEYYDLEIK